MEGDLALSLAAVDNGDDLDALGGVDGGVVAQVLCRTDGGGCQQDVYSCTCDFLTVTLVYTNTHA